ncbi:MAG: TetR/AcrR family transcriptional regulator [Anaerovoracaceae bacterium]
MTATKTRERIMLTAIEMFNRKGSTNVSTAQLASEMQISPGNLYYYFNNKEHVIRSIWKEIITPQSTKLFYGDGIENSPVAIVEFFLGLARHTYSYRFFYLDLPALAQNDPQLWDLYRTRAEKVMERIDIVFDRWVELGIMSCMAPNERKLLIENLWLLSQTGIKYSQLFKKNAQHIEICNDVIQHLYALICPHITEEIHLSILAEFKTKANF